MSLIVVALAMAVLCQFNGCAKSERAGVEPSGGGNQAQVHLEQAATSIIAAAKESVHAASSDEQAVNRANLSVKALQIIGLLGDVDTEAQTAKLLDDLQAGARPAVVEAIIQMRLARQLGQWNDLDASQREKALNRFVVDVKQSGLTRTHAGLLMRLSEMLEGTGQGDLAAGAIQELLPAFSASDDSEIQRMAPLLEGIVRRLPGNKLELKGTLLDGSQLDWDSYRGKVVLVDFFASWCGPCREEVPNVIANYRAFHDKGFEVVGVNMDKDRRAAEAYVKQAGFDFPTLFSDDPSAKGWDNPMGRKYGVTALPRVILVDKEGVVVDTEARGQKLGMLLQELLGPAGAAADGSSGQTDAAPEEPSVDLDTEADVVPAAFEQEAAPQVEDEESPAPQSVLEN